MTRVAPVLLQTPLSETPEPLHSRVMPMRANASSQNSRTLKEEQNNVNTNDSKMKHASESAIPVAFASSNHEVIWGLALIGTTLHSRKMHASFGENNVGVCRWQKIRKYQCQHEAEYG
jgi:hypothetical protein